MNQMTMEEPSTKRSTKGEEERDERTPRPQPPLLYVYNEGVSVEGISLTPL